MSIPARRFVLRHIATGEFYARTVLGSDVRTAHVGNARAWATSEAAARFTARWGTRYEVVPLSQEEATMIRTGSVAVAPPAPVVPAHQRPEACHLCGVTEDRHTGTVHLFWSNEDAMAEAAAHDAQVVLARTPEAAYVEQHRPY